VSQAAVPVTAHVTGWDRAVVVLLGGAGCALSFSALQQMAVAIHIRPALCWLFPLVIDGFIAYGVRALLVLRTAPLRARLYVWLLFGTATAVSVWANALHAVRLNQESTAVTGLRLGDTVVAVLSTVAPLALAGAVHLYILIARGQDSRRLVEDVVPGHGGQPELLTPTRTDRAGRHTSQLDQVTAGHPVTETTERSRLSPERPNSDTRTVTEKADSGDWAGADTGHRDGTPGDGDRRPRAAGDRQGSPDTEKLLAIARSAVKAEDKLTRRVVAQAIRGQKIPLSNDTLTQLMNELRQQHGQPVTASRD
jgi:Protein of unknown function (DUF2637)